MAILGDNTQGGDTFPGSGDRAILTRFTATEAGTINSAGAYFVRTGAGENAKVIMYTNNAGIPGTLVAASSGSAITASGLTTFAMTGSFSAGLYFIGVVFDGGSGGSVDVSEDAVGTEVTEMANGTFSYASPPASWPGSDASYVVRVNAYVDYSAAPVGAQNQLAWIVA